MNFRLLLTYLHIINVQRVNYHAINDGSDEEAPEEDHIFKKP
jgi:hypothetical protein